MSTKPKHYMRQDRHGHSYHACGKGNQQSGKESAYDWSEVTCKDCLRYSPVGLRTTEVVR